MFKNEFRHPTDEEVEQSVELAKDFSYVIQAQKVGPESTVMAALRIASSTTAMTLASLTDERRAEVKDQIVEAMMEQLKLLIENDLELMLQLTEERVKELTDDFEANFNMPMPPELEPFIRAKVNGMLK